MAVVRTPVAVATLAEALISVEARPSAAAATSVEAARTSAALRISVA